MKSRPLLAIALLLIASFFASAKSLSEETQRARLKMLHLENPSIRPTLVERAYLDTYRMLDGDNSCGRFFGKGARWVLDELVVRLREKTILDTRLGIKMSGFFTTHIEPHERTEYRLFERVDLNTLGPFYKVKAFPSQPYVPKMGSFAPNTREARAMILLHELGHLIKSDGTWLIPDDGDDAQLSRRNTAAIEAKCGEQIRAL